MKKDLFFSELPGPEDTTIVESLIRHYLDERILIFNNTVDVDILEDITLQIIRFNHEDKGLPVDQRKPIKLYIQSPGGDMVSGFNLIDVIEASKTPVYTVCMSNCSSMAFYLFISGHKRYAFKNSILLNHDGEISLSNSNAKAKDTFKFFEEMEARSKDFVVSHTAITPEFYDSIYNKEYFMYANEEAKELGCVDYIIGEDVTLDEILQDKNFFKK